MDSYKRHKLKEKIKKKKGWIIGTGLFLLAGVGAWVAGSFLSGANPIEWLTSPFAITIYILVGLCLLASAYLLYFYFMRKDNNE